MKHSLGIGACAASISLLANNLETGGVRGVLFAVVVCIASAIGAHRAVQP